jgi:hypothetical protein
MTATAAFVALAACGAPQPVPAPPKVVAQAVPADAPSPDAPPDAMPCEEQTRALAAWLAPFADEPVWRSAPRGIRLVPLPGADKPDMLYITDDVVLEATDVRFHGVSAGDPTNPDALPRLVHIVNAGREDHAVLVFVIDADVPWGTVAPVVNAVAAIGDIHVVEFALEAGRTDLRPPPPSEIDAPVLDLGDHASTMLSTRVHAEIGKAVFARCPELWRTLGFIRTAADVVRALPQGIAACGCQVSIPSVQRLAWSWWNRDGGAPIAHVGMKVVPNGRRISTRPTAPWSEAATLVIEASKSRKPVTFR